MCLPSYPQWAGTRPAPTTQGFRNHRTYRLSASSQPLAATRLRASSLSAISGASRAFAFRPFNLRAFHFRSRSCQFCCRGASLPLAPLAKAFRPFGRRGFHCRSTACLKPRLHSTLGFALSPAFQSSRISLPFTFVSVLLSWRFAAARSTRKTSHYGSLIAFGNGTHRVHASLRAFQGPALVR